MVVIRLARGGSKKRPFYAMDDPEDPKYTLSFDLLFRGLEVTTGGQRIHDYERIGFYNPMASGAAPRLSINEASLNAWVANGAQMSDTVARLYKEFKKAAAPAA